MTTFLIIIGVIILLFIILAVSPKSENYKKFETDMIQSIEHTTVFEKSDHFKTKLFMNQYAGGHPAVDTEIDQCYAYFENNIIKVFAIERNGHIIRNKFQIQLNAIKDILVEDASTFDKRVTLGRVLLVGVFALAWKKKKKDSLAILSIEWNDGRFNHSTMFYFDGSNAMNNANKARNRIIRECGMYS